MGESVSITVRIEPPRFTGSGGDEVCRLAPSSFTAAADGDEKLAAVIDRTVGPILADHLARIGAPAGLSFSRVSFIGPGGKESVDPGEVAVLDKDGRLRVLGDVQDGTVGELIAAHATGLLEADPRQVVVRPEPPVARVGGGGWEVVAQGLHVLWHVAQDIAVVGGAAGGIGWVLRRLRRATPVLERHASDLDRAGIRPPTIQWLIATRPWSTAEIRRALGLTAAEVDALLPGLGFEQDRDGLWRPSSDPRAMRLAAELISLASGYEAIHGEHEELAKRYREHLAERERRYDAPGPDEPARREL